MGNDKVDLKILAMELIPWRDLKDIQGDLKTLGEDQYLQLRQSLLDNGFAFPFFVWNGSRGLYTIDGHIRKMTLSRMVAEGIEVPDELPGVFIYAENRIHAKKLLLLLNSRYGHITEDGLYNFTQAFSEIDEDFLSKFVDLPEINISQYLSGYGPEDLSLHPDPEPPDQDQATGSRSTDKITKCPGCGYDLEGLL